MAKEPLICACVAVLASLAGASARAATPPPAPPENPAVAQYVEAVPTSGGPVVPTGGGHARLPRKLTRTLRRAGPTGEALVNVASSAAFGAPQKRLRASARVRASESQAAAKAAGPVSGSSLGAAGSAIGGGHGVILWLALALLAVTAAGAGAAVRRARR
ncbi:MAG: hypothetical protein V7644_2631 [Actinomycetota bacterium]|jgi:hypothetical protein